MKKPRKPDWSSTAQYYDEEDLWTPTDQFSFTAETTSSTNSIPQTLTVTEILDCWRRIQYRLEQRSQAPQHFLSWKGHFIHDFIAAVLRHQTPSPIPWGTFKKHQQKIIPIQLNLLRNVAEWMKTTKFDLREALVEPQFEAMLSGYRILGHPDLVLPKQQTIIDFKASQPSSYKRGLRQLAAYKLLAEQSAMKITKLCNVFLGGNQPVEHYWPKAEVEKAEVYFINHVERLTGMLEAKQDLPASFSFQCGWCSYRHICQGI